MGQTELFVFQAVLLADAILDEHLPVPRLSLSPTCSDQGRENRSSQFNGNQDVAAGGNKLQVFDSIKLCLLLQTKGDFLFQFPVLITHIKYK